MIDLDFDNLNHPIHLKTFFLIISLVLTSVIKSINIKVDKNIKSFLVSLIINDKKNKYYGCMNKC